MRFSETNRQSQRPRPSLGLFSTGVTQGSLVRHWQVHKPRGDGQEHYNHE